MDAFDVLTNKGDELVAQRDKTANEGERALLNKQIKAIRMAQFKLISNEVIEKLNRRSHKSLLTLLKPPDWRNALPG
ncbi:TPA: hypothetical protein KL772_002554 [Escherichia coli]|nr:hypothetical protein [Escherichia coli]